MASAAPAATRAGRTYEQYRNDLIVRGVTLPAVVVFLVTALYATSEALYAPQRFWPGRWAYLAETLTPLIACWLCRGRLRQHAQLVLLGADLTYSVGVLVQALQPTTTIAGAALAIAIKVMATAVFFPWQPRLQYISASVTIAGYWTILYPGGRIGGADSALFQTLGPCIAAVLSAAGAAVIDRNRRAMFEARAWLQLATESAKVALWTCDLRTLTIRFSSGRKRVLGRDESEISLAAQWDLVHPDDRTQAIATLQAHLQKRTSLYENERRMLHADGSYRWVLIRSTTAYDSEGQPCVQYGADIDITERKTLEETLREARAALEIAVTAARVGIWDWDLQTVETHYADSWRTLFGYSPAEFDGSMEAWSKIVHPDDLKRLERSTSMITAIAGPTAHYEEEFRLRHRDGTYRWVLSRATVLRDAAGIPWRMVGAHVDISDLKRAEDAARRSTRQVQALFEASVDVISILEADGTFRDVSPSIRWLLGYEVSDVVGRDGFDFVHPDDCAALRAAFASRAAEPGNREPVQYRLQRADGSWVYVESTVNNLLSDPAVRGLVVTTRDITERTRLYAEMAALNRELEARVAERTVQLWQANAILTERITECERVDRARRESEERFALAVAGANDGIWDLDYTTGELYVSSRVKSILGLKEAELDNPREKWLNRVSPEDAERVEAAMRAHLTGSTPRFESEYQIRHEDGSYRWVLSRALAVRDALGKPRRMVGSITDITERKRTEEALQAAHNALEAQVVERTVAGDILQALNAHLNLADAFPAVGAGLQRLTGCSFSGLTLFDDDSEWITYIGLSAGPVPVEPNQRWRIADVPAVADILAGRTRLVPDLALERDSPGVEFLYTQGFRSGLSLPLRGSDRIAGMLTLVWRRPGGPNAAQMPLLGQIADAVALAVEKTRLFEQVDTGRERLKALSRRLIEIQETERRHFARELHDEIGQVLTGLHFLLQSLRGLPPAAAKRMAEAEQLVTDLCGQVRNLSLELRPSMLDDLGLLPALLWLFGRYTAQTGITVTFEHRALEQRFPAEQETAAYRIVQEALTNVARHARVAAVTVGAWVEGGVLGVQIADEGIGFDTEKALAAGTSGGLPGMRERALLVGGTVRITSVPGRRTEVSVYIPTS